MKYRLLYLILLSAFATSAQNPAVKWTYNIKDMAFGQSAAADLDQDGKLEIVFSTYRNDSTLYVLNAENGSLKWKYNVGGCADAAPLIFDVDQDGDYEIVLAGSCNPKTFCFDADSGFIQWQTPMYGSDSPPTVADLDNDGKLEIIHGQFGGYVISINGEDGSANWNFQVDTNCWVQTAPAIMDVDKNGQLDFVVATWSFVDTATAIYCYRGDNHALLWKNVLPRDVIYHGAAFGDIDKDGKQELTIGDYNGEIFCLNAEDGSVNWRDSFPGGFNYIGAPTSLADLDGDGQLDVVICDAYHVRARRHNGSFLWDYNIPNFGTAFRGVAIADISNDNTLDVTFGTSKGLVISLDGKTGLPIKSFDLAAHYGDNFEVDHAPIIADFDGDGIKDLFIIGGHAEYPNVSNNYGRAYALSWGIGNGPDWTMFRRDERRSGCVCDTSGNPLNVPRKAVESAISVYPTPATNILTVDFGNAFALYEIRMTDLLGRNIEVRETVSGSRHFLDVSALPAGVYILRLGLDDKEIVRKFIKH